MTIQDALEKFFKADLTNDYKCESCKTIGSAEITRKFTQLPRILILQLKRYENKSKSDSYVHISNQLSLKSHLLANNGNPNELKIIPPKVFSINSLQDAAKQSVDFKIANNEYKTTPTTTTRRVPFGQVNENGIKTQVEQQYDYDTATLKTTVTTINKVRLFIIKRII